jgi:hypothetical protein
MNNTSTVPDLRLRRRMARHSIVGAWLLLLIGGFVSVSFSVYSTRTYTLPHLLDDSVGVMPFLLAVIGSHTTASYRGELWIKMLAVIATVATVTLSTTATIDVLWHMMGYRSILVGLVSDLWDVVAVNIIMFPRGAIALSAFGETPSRVPAEASQGDPAGHPESDPADHPESDPADHFDLDPEMTLEGASQGDGQGHPDTAPDDPREGDADRREGVPGLAVARVKRIGAKRASDDQLAAAVHDLIVIHGTGLTPYKIVNELKAGRKGSIGEERAGRILTRVLAELNPARTG